MRCRLTRFLIAIGVALGLIWVDRPAMAQAADLSDADISVVPMSDPSGVAAPANGLRKSLSSQRLVNVVPGQRTYLTGWVEVRTSTCAQISSGSWTVTAPPTQGAVSFGTVTGALGNGVCPGRLFTYGAIYYTWTGTGDVTSDSFSATWSTEDGHSERETFDLQYWPVRPEKNAGDCCACAGDPINCGTGALFETETDFAGAPNVQIALTRFYNSNLTTTSSTFGADWTSTYHRSISATAAKANVTRPTGQVETFQKNASGAWVGDPDVKDRLTALPGGGWLLNVADDSTEQYSAAGRLTTITTRSGLVTTLAYDGNRRLIRVTGPFGHVMTFAYDGEGRVVGMKAPDGGAYSYAYDAKGNLISATYPDGTHRNYRYENTNFPNFLTGLVDENGNLFSSWTYNARGRATSSRHAGGADLTTLTYAADTTTVADARGNAFTSTFTPQFGVTKLTAISGAPVQAYGGKAFAYDARGFLASVTDWNGNVTTLAHDQRGNETSRTHASGTPLARTIRTSWHASFHLPKQIVEPGHTTTFTYDAKGNLLARTIAAGALTRVSSYSYNSVGQVTSATDPRGNETSFVYDARGNLARIEDALGRSTAFTSYDGAGRLLRMVDPNGLVTTLTYDRRGRVASRTEGALKTRYEYDAAGNLIKATSPDGSYLSYSYDAAHRLVGVADRLGNSIAYTLDAASNRIAERAFDLADALKRAQSFTYDSVNRLRSSIGAAGRTTYAYDLQGNLVTMTDPLSHATAYAYDALDRLAQSIDPKGGTTQHAYDANDRPTAVTDPRGLRTSYGWNGLGDPISTTSPDSGATTKTFDAAGNVLTSTDARGKRTSYSYDALNRLTRTAFADGTSVAYQYDQGSKGIGRLTTIVDPTAATRYVYDANGRVTQKQQTIGAVTLTTSYVYSAGGRLSSMTYPSGRKIVYARDAAGHVSGVTMGAQTLVSGVSYLPFGAASGWTFGNGAAYARSFDRDGRVTGLSLPANDNLALTYDGASRVTKIADSAVATKSFGYDALDRLTAYAGGTLTQSYGYDANGNRVSATLTNGATSTALAYATAPTSNRLATISGAQSESFVHDAAGNLVSRAGGDRQFAYGARGRMALARTGALKTNYGVNGLGQRVVKSNAANPDARTIFVYDEAGRLLGEYGPTGAPIQETVWLDDLPIATLQATGTFYIAPDHLGAPHQITNGAKQVVWLWDHDPFGNGAPKTVGGFAYNLRFPGQYFDAETALHYNYFRDYDPKLGRYVESDPIGLAGGISGYVYVEGNPLSFIDPQGEFLNFVIGGFTGAATGYLLSAVTGDCYTLKDAFVDAALGAGGVGVLSNLKKLYELNKLRKLAKTEGLIANKVTPYIEDYVSPNNPLQRLKIKLTASENASGSLSQGPRVEYRIAPGKYQNPFTGGVGSGAEFSHVPIGQPSPIGAGVAGAIGGATSQATCACSR